MEASSLLICQTFRNSGLQRVCVFESLRGCMLVRVLLVVSICITASLSAAPWAGDHVFALKTDLDERWTLHSQSKAVLRDDFSDFLGGYTGLGLSYQLTERWNARGGYRHVWADSGEEWLQENRPYAEASYARSFEGFRFKNRARFEYRAFDFDKDDALRYRNQLAVEAPWKLTALELQPFVEEEVFYSVDDERIDMNRLGAGVAWRPLDGVKLKLGYRWTYFRSGEDFISRNVLTTALSLAY